MSGFSYTTMATPDWDGKTAIKKAREYGYQGVDLRISDHLGELKLTSTDSEINELKKIFQEEDIIPSSLLAYNTQASGDPASLIAFEDSVFKNLELGTKLGTKLVRITVGKSDAPDGCEEFIKRVAEVLSRVLGKETSSTSLIIQNHGSGIGIHDILKIIEQVNNPRLNMVLCPANAACMKEEFDDVMPKLKIDLPMLYIADLVFSKEYPHGFKSVLPGKGIINFKKIYEGLGGNGFQGWLTFKWEKIWERDLPGPETALPHFIEYAKKLTEKV